MHHRWTAVRWTALAIVLGVGPAAAGETSRSATTVSVVRPNTKPVTQTLALPGSLEPYERAELHSRVTGYLKTIRVDVGDRVQQGDVLAELSLPEMASQLRLAEAQVTAAGARLEKAQADAELEASNERRLAELRRLEPGAVTGQEVEVAASKAKVAAAQREVARAEQATAAAEGERWRSLLAYSTIRAPFGGIVTARYADPGALVVAGGSNGSRPVAEVSRTDLLRLVLSVPESVAPFTAPGRRLSFAVDAVPGRSFEGEIARVAGALARDTRSMRAEIDVDNHEGLFKPGMYAKVRLELREIPNAVTLPARSLRSIGGETAVYVVEDGTARRLPVSILMDDGAEVVVAAALDPETPVIVSGPPSFEDGARVEVREP